MSQHAKATPIISWSVLLTLWNIHPHIHDWPGDIGHTENCEALAVRKATLWKTAAPQSSCFSFLIFPLWRSISRCIRSISFLWCSISSQWCCFSAASCSCSLRLVYNKYTRENKGKTREKMRGTVKNRKKRITCEYKAKLDQFLCVFWR